MSSLEFDDEDPALHDDDTECPRCDGEGAVQGFIPGWDDGEWRICGLCKGTGERRCQDPDAPEAPSTKGGR